MIKKYLNKLSQYPRLRIILIIVVIIIVVIGLFDLFSPSSHKSDAPGGGIGSSNIQTQDLQAGVHSTTIGSQQYKETAEKLKEEAKNKKTESGSSYFGGVFDDANKSAAQSAATDNQPATKTSDIKTPEQILKGESASASSSATNTSTESPSEFMKYHETSSGGDVNQYQDVNGGLESAMRTRLQSLQDDWKLPQQAVVEGAEPEADTSGASAGDAGSNVGADVLIKAGTIMFAVLDNTLNSDYDQTTAMATIVAGKYRGAKLLGSFNRGGYDSEAVTLNFTQMILPTQNDAIGINAIAVDPKTAQGALASSVNHHYLERFGSLFAAAFLQGFGNAYSNYQNPCYGTNNCFIDGNIQRPSVTTKTAAYQGLGQIGTNVASIVANNFNRPITVILKQGTAMGIMFLGGVTNSPPKQASGAYTGNLNQASSDIGSAVGTAVGSAVNSAANQFGNTSTQSGTNFTQSYGQNTANQQQQSNTQQRYNNSSAQQPGNQPQF